MEVENVCIEGSGMNGTSEENHNSGNGERRTKRD